MIELKAKAYDILAQIEKRNIEIKYLYEELQKVNEQIKEKSECQKDNLNEQITENTSD